MISSSCTLYILASDSPPYMGILLFILY